MALQDTIKDVIEKSGGLIVKKLDEEKASAADLRAINEWIKLAQDYDKSKSEQSPILSAIMQAKQRNHPIDPTLADLDTESDDPATA